MGNIKPQTLKGFRDFLPEKAKKRQWLMNTLREVFESYGFEPLETPALEYEEVLLGKYGDEGDKLMYRFEDNGKRKVALRYDQTVPLARVVAQYQNDLTMPFKRYQIQNVWRAENTQKGRFREFVQCDIDTVGTSSPLADAEMIELTYTTLERLGFEKFKLVLNDRENFKDISSSAVLIIDKLKKIGIDGVIKELADKKLYSDEEAEKLIESLQNLKPTEYLADIIEKSIKLGVDKDVIEFSPTLARGLNYYTGLIFEVEIEGYDAGSVAGGGRYDDLIGMFAGKQIPAVGFAFGFDRLMEALEQFDLFPKDLGKVKALVTIFSPELLEKSIEICELLSKSGIGQELYLDENTTLEKQLKYANKKGIPFSIIVGPKEAEEGKVTIKNMKTGDQKTINTDNLKESLSQA